MVMAIRNLWCTSSMTHIPYKVAKLDPSDFVDAFAL